MKIKILPETKIKNIIFDLGGVLLNIDYSLTSKAFRSLGIKGFDNLYSQAMQTSLFDDFEKGFIDAPTFRKGLRAFINIDDTSLDKAWNAMLLDFPANRIQLLEKLKKEYRLFLLSNTNDIHIKWYSDHLLQKFGFKDLSLLFEKEYYSYNIGMRKPDEEIFNFVLTENDLKAEETLFIDDSPQHIKGAEKTGINTYLLRNPETILDLFEEHEST